jgi:hypothetical protein
MREANSTADGKAGHHIALFHISSNPVKAVPNSKLRVCTLPAGQNSKWLVNEWLCGVVSSKMWLRSEISLGVDQMFRSDVIHSVHTSGNIHLSTESIAKYGSLCYRLRAKR